MGYILILLLVLIPIQEALTYERISLQKSSESVYATITAYNSEVGQTDSSPFITASGKKTTKGIVANNCIDFGTKIKIEGEIFVVEDRMNSRYGCEYYDIWMETYDEAINFGRQRLLVYKL